MIVMAFGFVDGFCTSLFVQYRENAIIKHLNNVSFTIFCECHDGTKSIALRQRNSCLESELNVGREKTENNTKYITSRHLSVAFICILTCCTQQKLQHDLIHK